MEKRKPLKPTFGKTWDAHYINAYLPLVSALRKTIAWADANKQRAGTLPVDEFKALLEKLGGDRA